MEDLEELELSYLSKLENIEMIIENKDKLKILSLEFCKKINCFDCIRELINLNKLTLCSCGDIPNLKFIKELKKLNNFVFLDTNIIDGNLSYCLGIDYVAFTNKKHFSHREKDFKNSI